MTPEIFKKESDADLNFEKRLADVVAHSFMVKLGTYYAVVAYASERKSAQRRIPTERYFGAVDGPAHGFRLVHVRSERSHDVDLQRVLKETPKGTFIHTCRKRSESFREWTGEKRTADQTVCRRQLLDHLGCTDEKGQHPPMGFQGQVE